MTMNLQGKTVFITGATDGLGKAVALRAAKAGATLILHGRNAEKGASLVTEIKEATANENVHYHNADFSSLAQVKKLGEEVAANYDALHVLINNAAIGGGPKGSRQRELSQDGYELRFAVNHLSHFLLTQKLLPLLERSAPSRIVNVASIGQSPLNFDDLQLENRYDSFDAYAKSKLAQIIFGFALADKLKDKHVTVNSLHPASLMDTNMVAAFFGRTTSTVEEGADVVEYVAFSPETKDVTGAYFNQLQQAKANAQAYDAEARKKLWQLSEELVKDFS
ncbi:MAG TPA: SDR family NAD(P)-dependent oxidoreductase [Flavisolibacter sp.]|nr:SDR family NAD(P)-dependent oxidoreductase [Flavisolibacter sp.]